VANKHNFNVTGKEISAALNKYWIDIWKSLIEQLKGISK
jgi:hypothetical protein